MFYLQDFFTIRKILFPYVGQIPYPHSSFPQSQTSLPYWFDCDNPRWTKIIIAAIKFFLCSKRSNINLRIFSAPSNTAVFSSIISSATFFCPFSFFAGSDLRGQAVLIILKPPKLLMYTQCICM